jgi:NhaA family Na+:H+ antiporter
VRRLFHIVIDNSLLLIAGTVAALIWANTGFTSYEHFAHAWHFAVNDIGMVFFFALATKEVFEATLPGGALASPRESAVPLFAAVGGMAMPAITFFVLIHALQLPELSRGWAVPCATDIAFSYMAARVVFRKGHPAIPFLLLLAIADDALGLVILAVFYPSQEIAPLLFAGVMAIALVIAWLIRRQRVTSYWPYVILAGGCSWLALYKGGFHPALALVPIVPFLRDRETLHRFEHQFKVPVQIVLGLFGLVNAGVPFANIGVATGIVVMSLVAGKPIGILAFTWLAERFGFRRAQGLAWRDVLVLGMLAGVGFTVALFFATAAFPAGRLLDEVKMGALFSFVAAPIGVALSRIVRGRRPAPPPTAAAHSPRS